MSRKLANGANEFVSVFLRVRENFDNASNYLTESKQIDFNESVLSGSQ